MTIADLDALWVLISAQLDAIQLSIDTNGVIINPTQGAITWGQQKIVANVAGEGALDIENTNSSGHGTMSEGNAYGVYNKGDINGIQNEGTSSAGMKNTGGTYGQTNQSSNYGWHNTGSLQPNWIGADGDTLETLSDQLDGVSGGTGGALSLTYTVNKTGGGVLEGATVKLYSDSTRTTLVNAKTTDVLGQVTFTNLVAGTYYLTTTMSGYSDMTDTEVVS